MYGWSEAEAPALVEQLARGEDVTSSKTQRVTKDGTVLDVGPTVTKLVDEAGESYTIATTERDVTGGTVNSQPR